MGNSEVRRFLYMDTLGGVRGNNPLKSFDQRLVGRGKAKKVALIAAAKKFSFGPGLSSRTKLPGILIFIKLGLDKRERSAITPITPKVGEKVGKRS